MAEIFDLDTTDDDNTARFPEGQLPSTVNNGARALEGLLARGFRDTILPTQTSGGSANAQTLTTNQTITAYAAGTSAFTFKAGATNTGACTMNVDGLGAKSIKTTTGADPWAGAITAGGYYWIVYDGTNFVLLNPSGLADKAVTLAKMDDLAANKIIARATGSTGTPEAVGLNSTLAMDAGNLKVVEAFTAGDYSNLRIDVTGNATVDVDADRLTVYNSSGQGFRLGTVDLTLNLGNSGENGLDTGSEASNTWYAVHVIYNPTTSAIAGLLSTSATSPTLPSGYTYSRRIGWVRNDGSSNLFRTRQRNDEVSYVTGTNPSTPLNIGTGSTGSVTTPTWTAIAVAAFVPTTASAIDVHAVTTGSSSTVIVAPNASYGAWNSTDNPPPLTLFSGGGGTFTLGKRLLLESGNIHWASSNSNGRLYVAGWKDNL